MILTIYRVPRQIGESNQAGYRRINGVLHRDTEVTPSSSFYDVQTPGYAWSDQEISALSASVIEKEVEE